MKELTKEQEDYILEEGIERERDKRYEEEQLTANGEQIISENKECDMCGDKRIELTAVRIDEGEQILVCQDCYTKLEESYQDL